MFSRACASQRGLWLGLFSVLWLAFSCHSTGEATKEPPPVREQAAPVSLEGVDTSELSKRELSKWSEYVGELLAPCSDLPVSVAECVSEKKDCAACLPAAQFLAERVHRGNTRAQVESAYRARFAPDQVKSIEMSDSPALGSSNPSVVIVEWADFECPFCGLAAPLLKEVVSRYPDQVSLVFKHYPLSSHEHSEKAARAAVAAGKQGKFWELQQALFAGQRDGLDETNVNRMAKELDLDLKQFKTDRDSEATADRVARDRKQADELDLQGTPMIYINGRYFDLKHFDIREDLEPWIALEIELKTGKEPNAAAPKPAPEGEPAPEHKQAAAGK